MRTRMYVPWRYATFKNESVTIRYAEMRKASKERQSRCAGKER
jgi:hypothetical protein